MNKLPHGRILDIGCGLGFFLSAIDNGWGKYGIEPSLEASEYAEFTFGLNITQARIEDADYPDGSFDVVYLYHVIEHLVNPEAILQKINRMLRIDGKLIVGSPNTSSFCARRFKQNFRLLHDSGHISLFSADGLSSLLIDCGFKIERIRYPFFKTKYFTLKNLLRLFDTSKISPPFYGNIVTIYAVKNEDS